MRHTELLAVLGINTASVEDPCARRNSGRYRLGEELTDLGVSLLRLSRRSYLPGTYSPDGLVGNDDLAKQKLNTRDSDSGDEKR